MNSDPKVIAFEKLQTKQRESAAKYSPNRVFVQARAIFIEGVAERMARFFTKADDELFRLSEKSDNSILQSHYFSNMRYLRREREFLQDRYLQDLTAFYEAFWRNMPLPDLGARQASGERGELTLLEDELLEESLAINGMVEKGESLFYKDLRALDKRFMALLGKNDGMIEFNPVSPLVLCRLFAKALAALDLEFKVKLLALKLFDKQVLSAFGAVYHDLNAHMVKAGILPSLAKAKQPRLPRIEDAMAVQSARHFIKEYGDKPQAGNRQDAFENMRILMEAWRCRLGAPQQVAAHWGEKAGNTEVLSVLGLLQQPSQMRADGGGILSSEQMKRFIANQVANFHADGKKPSLDRQVEDVIDLVGMIFVYILEDRHLPASVKAMLAGLQIPILKVAILEKSFFAQKNHPARLLLNSLAQAGMGLDGDLESDSPVFQKIESVIKRILVELDRDTGLFYELLEDFTAFMAIEHRRNRAAEERTRQVTQSREQIRQAKKAVAYVIALRLQRVSAPPILKSFLCNAWKDVLVLAWLRRDKDAENWSSAISLMDQLIGAIGLRHDPDALGGIGLEVPPLLDAMKNRLENLAYEQHWIMDLFKDLEDCCRICPDRAGSMPFCLGKEFDVKDADFAVLICEAEGGLLDGSLPWSLGGAPLGAEELLGRAAAPLDSEIGDEDEFSTKAGSLGIGQWVEFIEGQRAPRRAKLSWKSKESDVYIFVNAKGAKVMEMKRIDLACHLRLGGAKIIEDSGIPLMDRALSRLVQALEAPADAVVP